MADTKHTFRATVHLEDGEWIAHCLDLDVVAAGATREAAVDALAEAVGLQLAYAREEDNFDHLFRPAPHDAWQRLGAILNQPHETLVRSIDDTFSGNNLLEAQAA